MRINDNVLRFMTIQLGQNVDAESREEKAYERPQYDLDDGSEDAQDGLDDEEGQEQGRSDRYNDDNAGSGSSDAGEED
jgi:hypothetical protein